MGMENFSDDFIVASDDDPEIVFRVEMKESKVDSFLLFRQFFRRSDLSEKMRNPKIKFFYIEKLFVEAFKRSKIKSLLDL